MLSAYLSTAIEAAKAAAKLHVFYQGGDLEIDTKSNHTDLVTKVDKLCEAKIRDIILSAHPDHVVLGEEEGQSGEADYRWIVDPLDGTLNYAHGFPVYCVSIALEIKGRVEVAVVLDSSRDELFTAVLGEGAYCNGALITGSKEVELGRSMLATGFAYDVEVMKQNIEIFARVCPQVRAVRRAGAAALDLCYVACGRLDGYWELSLNAWDVAAGWLIIQESGGTLTGGAGQPYSFQESVLVASNGHLHAKMLNCLDLGDTLA